MGLMSLKQLMTNVLHLNWNKVNCDWVGFGNSWSNFEADDISELYDNSAIRIEVKTVDDEQQFLPFVVGLEDYSEEILLYFQIPENT